MATRKRSQSTAGSSSTATTHDETTDEATTGTATQRPAARRPVWMVPTADGWVPESETRRRRR